MPVNVDGLSTLRERIVGFWQALPHTRELRLPLLCRHLVQRLVRANNRERLAKFRAMLPGAQQAKRVRIDLPAVRRRLHMSPVAVSGELRVHEEDHRRAGRVLPVLSQEEGRLQRSIVKLPQIGMAFALLLESLCREKDTSNPRPDRFGDLGI